jgi:hypothetical protein
VLYGQVLWPGHLCGVSPWLGLTPEFGGRPAGPGPGPGPRYAMSNLLEMEKLLRLDDIRWWVVVMWY